MAECSHMLDDGGCKILPDNRQSNQQFDPKRPEGDIAISKSVGQGGANIYDDVYNIQYGLDQVAPIDGGPSPQLLIDGKCGPKTIAARTSNRAARRTPAVAISARAEMPRAAG